MRIANVVGAAALVALLGAAAPGPVDASHRHDRFCRHGGRWSGHWRGDRPYRHAYRPAPYAYAPYDHGYRYGYGYGGYGYGYAPYVPHRFGPYVRDYYGPRYRHGRWFPRPHVSLHIRLF